MTDAITKPEESAPRAKTAAEAPDAPPQKKLRLSRRIVLIGCGGVTVVLLSLVALLRPALPEPHEAEAALAEAPEEAPTPALSDETASAGFAETEGPCSRPAAAAGLAALAQADAAYDAGEFPRARDLYLDPLLSGGDLGAGGDA